MRPGPAPNAQNRGTILHALVLEMPEPFQVLDVPDYKTAAARELRAETVAAGLIPVKLADMEELEDVASAIRERLRDIPEAWAAMQAAIADGMSEATLIWREQGVLCRCRYDTLPPPRFRATYDLKFTGVSAEPEAFGKKVTGDYLLQAGLYPRAVQALRGDRPLFVFVACEWEPPFAISLHALDPEAQALAADKLDAALATWRGCLQSGVWPSYPPLVHYHGAPAVGPGLLGPAAGPPAPGRPKISQRRSFRMRPQNSVRRSLAERFADKFIPEPNSGCWLWIACVNAGGYGQITLGERVQGSALAHRVSWELHHGKPPPRELMVCHRCDNPACVNPDHPFFGTSSDNSEDCSRKGSVNRTIKLRGESHAKSKMTDAGVLRVRTATSGIMAISKELGVSYTTVKSIRRRETWRHLP